MPRSGAYAITLTTKTRQRIFDLLDIINDALPKERLNAHGAVIVIKQILIYKGLHKMIK